MVLGQHERALHDLHAAKTLAEALDDPRRLGRVALSLAQCFLTVDQLDHAIASSQHALALAATSGDIDAPIEANNCLGLVYLIQGDYRQAMDACRRAIALLEGERRDERLGQPVLPAVGSRTYLSICLAEVGAFAEGIAVGGEGLRMAEAVQHPNSLVLAYEGVGRPHLRQGVLHQALPLLERAVGLCEDADLRFHFSRLAPLLGSTYVLCGRVEEAVQLLERVLAQTTSSSIIPMRMLQCSALGEAYLHAGRLEEAHTLAARALEYFQTHQHRGREAYALHLLGDIATQCEPLEPKPVEAYYQQALALAEDLGMRPLAAHCHLGLGTLYAATGQQEQARAECSIAIELYKAMEMTFWLPRAEAALAQVEGR
jgi:tetratricopeptide (TPR) repeat protein